MKFIVPANGQSLTMFATTGKRTRLVAAVAIASPQTSFGVRLSRIHFSVGEK